MDTVYWAVCTVHCVLGSGQRWTMQWLSTSRCKYLTRPPRQLRRTEQSQGPASMTLARHVWLMYVVLVLQSWNKKTSGVLNT